MDLLTARKGNPLTIRSRDRPVRSVGAVGRLVDAAAACVPRSITFWLAPGFGNVAENRPPLSSRSAAATGLRRTGR
jgi:hypothetical protein